MSMMDPLEGSSHVVEEEEDDDDDIGEDGVGEEEVLSCKSMTNLLERGW